MTKTDIRPSRKAVLKALKMLAEPLRIGKCSLAYMVTVEKERQSNGYPNSEIGHGQALRDVLLKGIEQLRYGSGDIQYDEKQWRPYVILHERFVRGRSHIYLQDRLHIAQSTLNHEQAAALDRLVGILQEWEERIANNHFNMPYQAPPRPPYALVGRDALLSDLKQRVFAEGGQTSFALLGLPGVGKTALAIELANDSGVQQNFPDGVLWARLGRSPDLLSVLSNWGSALGVTKEEAATLDTIESWVEFIHAKIGRQRLLLVIDDAWDAEQALAFRLGGPNCVHLLTTRQPPVAVHFAGEGVIAIPELGQDEGLTLLTRAASKVVEDEPESARALVDAVGGLPLALTLVGKHLQIQALANGRHSLMTLFDSLQGAEERFSLSQPQEILARQPSLPSTAKISLTTIIGLSDEALSPTSRRMLRALSLFPPKPNTFSLDAALHISSESKAVLDDLVEHGLVECNGTTRYALHQTIADYARLRSDDTSVSGLLVGYFAEYAQANEQNFAALSVELPNIQRALDEAHDSGAIDLLINTVNALYQFLQTRGLYSLAIGQFERALQVVNENQSSRDSVVLCLNLGKILVSQGRYELAQEHYQQALRMAQESNLEAEVVKLKQAMAVVEDHRGNYERARELYLQCLNSVRKSGDLAKMTTLLLNLGGLAVDLGQNDRAESYLKEGIATAREIGQIENLSPLLVNLGMVFGSQGDYQQEIYYYQEALSATRQTGHHEDMLYVLTNLGAVSNDLGLFDQARGYLTEGLELAREIGHKEREGGILRYLGDAELAARNLELAEQHLQDSLSIAREIGQQRNLCGLMAVLGELYVEQEKLDLAARYLDEGLSIAREIGHKRNLCDLLVKSASLHFKQQQFEAAELCLDEGLELAEELDEKALAAEAWYGLARVLNAQGFGSHAREAGEKSQTILESIGHHKTDEVKVWLAGLASSLA